MHDAGEACAHLDGRSRQDDSEVCGQLLDGFREFGFAIFDHVTLVEDAVIKLDVAVSQKQPVSFPKTPPTPLPESEVLGKYTPEKVDVVPHNVVRRHYQVVLLHLVLQPGSKQKTVGAFQFQDGSGSERHEPHRIRSVGGPV